MELVGHLKPINVTLDQLLLDPNNPRFSELGEELNPVPESRYSDEKVQTSTLDKMKSPAFDVNELKDTMKTIGFLPMDRLVVRLWRANPKPQAPKYVVIEGNRRVTALKWLMQLHEIGKETFSETQIQNFTQFECLLLDDEGAPQSASLVLPGLRHVSGIKEWGPYQKAKAIHALRRSGMPPQEAAQSLGLSVRAANQAYRCYLALEQMKRDEEFGEYAVPRMYSYFEEALKRPNVKAWLDWNEEKEMFNSAERLREFYSWIVPTNDPEESPKLPEAKSIRELSLFIDDEAALSLFRSAEGTLSGAKAKYTIDHPEDWFPRILSATFALKQLTPDMIRGMDEQTMQSLLELKSRIEQTLVDREKLLAN